MLAHETDTGGAGAQRVSKALMLKGLEIGMLDFKFARS